MPHTLFVPSDAVASYGNVRNTVRLVKLCCIVFNKIYEDSENCNKNV